MTKMSKDKAQRMITYLESKRMAWCFDEAGTLWTLESLSLYILSPSAWRTR